MTPERFLKYIIWPGLVFLSDVARKPLGGAPAELMLLAIAGQESALTHRFQVQGPARGYWQFERGGGVAGVISHKATAAMMHNVLMDLGIGTNYEAAWAALPYSELLQVAAARCLLYTDPRPLPAPGDEAGAWDYYLRNWRPGKPHSDAWAGHYQAAMKAVRG